MLNRLNAELELKQTIHQLVPGWNENAELVAHDGARTGYYIDVLMGILPDFTFSSQFNSPPDLTQKVMQLRRRLINILANEVELNLEKSLCDTVFTIQLALAKLFPFNKELLVDENEQPLTIEAWEETFNFEILTRDTENLIIFPESAVLSRESTVEYYQGRYGKDEAGHPRNFDNTLMTARQILSLQSQGITIEAAQIQDEEDEYDYDFEVEANGEVSVGKYLGATLGKAVTYSAALAMMVLSRGPILFSASFIVGGITTLTGGHKGFVHGFLSTYLMGAAAQTFFVLSTAASYMVGMLAEETATLAVGFIGTSSLPLVLPTIIFFAAVHQSLVHNQNFSDTFAKMATNVFFTTPIKFSARLGELIENGFTSVFQMIKQKLSGNSLERTSNTFNSHARIIMALPINPASVAEHEPVAPESASFNNPVLFTVPIADQNDINDVAPSSRSGLSITI
jgi:hypothetical protein